MSSKTKNRYAGSNVSIEKYLANFRPNSVGKKQANAHGDQQLKRHAYSNPKNQLVQYF